ncbi:hypothetical protein [Halovivax gelatinilyticus]|uniref:hypothetical protein n=1 Tax=Halovivax gelatinilyticus TaxID=2961597 RepID=UPI0020CA5056|nr:hypothetical protein [Halovivax gelatinilyticus]
MTYGITRVAARLRQPEYTGDNRCIPCTIVNVVLAGVLASGLGVGAWVAADAGVGGAVSVTVFVPALGAIYFRGYLVPGTPTLTKRYFPDWLLAKYDKGPGLDADGSLSQVEEFDEGDPEPVDPEETLVDGGVLVPCAEVDDLCLADGLRERWREHVESVRSGDRTAQVAAFVELDPETVELDDREGQDRIVVTAEAGTVAHWESESALIADLAGARLLDEELSGWTDLPLAARGQIVGGLRAFLETCPSCDGEIEIDNETVESCCRSYEVYAVTCNDCEARLLEISA